MVKTSDRIAGNGGARRLRFFLPFYPFTFLPFKASSPAAADLLYHKLSPHIQCAYTTEERKTRSPYHIPTVQTCIPAFWLPSPQSPSRGVLHPACDISHPPKGYRWHNLHAGNIYPYILQDSVPTPARCRG